MKIEQYKTETHNVIILLHTANIMSTFGLPSTQMDLKFGPCDFEYLDMHIRMYVKDAYEVISRNELWRPFGEALLTRGVDNNTGFMFTTDPVYNNIKNLISSTYIGSGHSGFTIAYTMRELEFIALYGESSYRLRITEQN